MKLCCKHRHLAELSPQQAELMWCRLTELGETKIAELQWVSACSMFGTAFETAEILLMLGDACTRQSDLERYKHTLSIFVLCLKNCDYQVDYEGFYQKVCEKLRTENLREPFSQDLETIYDEVSSLFNTEDINSKLWKVNRPVNGSFTSHRLH